ncbi:CmpA/NrtA family ABC transporter substrate-binding protein [Roseivivax sp. CAU 1761]
MRGRRLRAGFIALVDAAPLIVARELGFAEEEGLDLDLVRAPSWSALRDMLCAGRVEAAHMLAPLPVATALGLGGGTAPLEALSVLSVNGTVIGVAQPLAERLADQGHGFGFDDAAAAGRGLIAAAGPAPLRVGVPFPFSMHAELVLYWLAALGLDCAARLVLRTIPPPLMPEAIRAGEIDAFCVGEPWGSRVVDLDLGALLLPGAAIWSFAPEKVLAVRQGWAAEDPDLRGRLIRAAWRAGRWLAQPDAAGLAAELLARPDRLDVAPDIVERALAGQLLVTPRGAERRVPRFLEFHAGAAAFPWRSQADWIGARLARRAGLDADAARAAARAVFRSDHYRAALSGTGADLPLASDRIEGGLAADAAAGSRYGRLILCRDAFFDGARFAPLSAERPSLRQ